MNIVQEALEFSCITLKKLKPFHHQELALMPADTDALLALLERNHIILEALCSPAGEKAPRNPFWQLIANNPIDSSRLSSENIIPWPTGQCRRYRKTQKEIVSK